MKYSCTLRKSGEDPQTVFAEISAQSITIKNASMAFLEQWKQENIIELQSYNGKHLLKHGKQFPFDTLEFTEPSIVTALRQLEPRPAYLKTGKGIAPFMGLIKACIILGIIAALLIGAFQLLKPVLISRVADQFSKEQEASLGAQVLKQQLLLETIDTARSRQANDFLAQLRIPGDYPIHITVVEKDMINAFALPGGEMVIFSGILDDMKSYSELVALIGHESGHVVKRHSLKNMLNSIANSIALSLIFGNTDALVTVLAGQAAEYQSLSYSRDAETESDEFGLEVMRLNKVDPQGMVDLFTRMQEAQGAAGAIPEFMSTHPKTENRIENITQKISTGSFNKENNSRLQSLFDALMK